MPHDHTLPEFDSTIRSGSRIHLKHLDGLRGWASLFVVLHHIWQFSVGQVDIGPVPRWFKIMTVLKYGPLAVTVFIVLSGYSLAIPVVRDPSLQLQGGVGGFAQRRSPRILPAYVATLVFAVLLLSCLPSLRVPGGTQWDIAVPAPGVNNVLAHLLFIHNLSDSLRWKLNPPLWSVALEWQIYFAFALVLLPAWRRHGAWALLALALILAVVPGIAGVAYLQTWYVLAFALGALAAWAEFSHGPPIARMWPKFPWRVAAGSLLIPVAYWLVVRKGDLNEMRDWVAVGLVHVCTAAATSCFLIDCSTSILAGSLRFLPRLSHILPRLNSDRSPIACT